MRWTRPLVVSGLLGLTACASLAPSSRGSDDEVNHRLTAAEIRATHARNAYEAVRLLRPKWLRRAPPSGVRDGNTALVYVDSERVGPTETLVALPAAEVLSMHFLDPCPPAPWSSTREVGAILVTTSRGDRGE